MKRDMELIRKILFQVEEKEPFEIVYNLKIDGYDKQAVAYHCELLYQAGLIKKYHGEDCNNSNGVLFFWVQDLTWEGHDFLDVIRQDTIWNKTKTAIVEKGVSLTVGTIKTIATAFITAATEGIVNSIMKNGGQP